jgi:hypothetical protein
VLVDDRRVLDGHLPAAELDEFAAEALMGFEKRGASQGHG